VDYGLGLNLIHYANQVAFSIDSLLNLYNSVGWSAYTNDPEKLQRAVANSSLVMSAWQDEELVGLIRCVSDGETIAYIQDILVMPGYQGQGIGDELMRQMLVSLKGIRQIVLMTDDGEVNQRLHNWYREQGFKSLSDLGTCSFAIFSFDS